MFTQNLFKRARSFFPKKLSAQNLSTIKARKMEKIKTLTELGYAFNAAGQLRKINDNGEPGDEGFQFDICDNHIRCQSHYEEIGAAVTPYIYHLLETDEHLQKLPVPVDSTPETGTFVFVSEDYDKKDVLMVLINGSGVVRAGQWARSLIINKSIEEGTQIPYIKKAKSKGYGIIILNTNDNFTPDDTEIQSSRDPIEHAHYVWDTYISKVNASSILIVAHSYGGVVTMSLAENAKDFEKKVKAVAFTDSVHGRTDNLFMKQNARNWVSSSKPLDTVEMTREDDIPRVSAGHIKHEMTSCSCMESVFKFFDEKLNRTEVKL